MKKILYILLSIFLVNTMLAQEPSSKNLTQPFAIGETITLSSKVLKENRILNIYLPQGYKESDKKYHVMYLLDGSADEDFIHIAGLVQFASFSWIKMIPETIVVGISNIDRKRDFTYPSTVERDRKEFPTTGGSEKFIKFIKDELQPYITSNYKVLNEKTLIGQSLGGLLATEILLKSPELFDNYIIVSPSIWWDDESLLTLTPKSLTSKKHIYLAVGQEGPYMETGAVKLHYKLRKAYPKNAQIFYKFLEEQDHGDALHLAVYDAFDNIFSKQ